MILFCCCINNIYEKPFFMNDTVDSLIMDHCASGLYFMSTLNARHCLWEIFIWNHFSPVLLFCHSFFGLGLETTNREDAEDIHLKPWRIMCFILTHYTNISLLSMAELQLVVIICLQLFVSMRRRYHLCMGLGSFKMFPA